MKKRIIGILLTIVMLTTMLPGFDTGVFAEGLAETVYFKSHDSVLRNAGSQVELVYQTQDGSESVVMTKNDNGFYSADVNTMVSNLTFRVLNSNGSLYKNYNVMYEENGFNCVYVPFGLSPVWGNYTSGIFTLEKALYFSPNPEWLQESDRFVVQFISMGNQTVTEELIPAGDGTYVTYDRDNINTYKFGVLRANATMTSQTIYTSAEIVREDFLMNHFVLGAGTDIPAGEWTMKIDEEPTPPGGGEPMPEDNVVWGYNDEYGMGYASLTDVLYNQSSSLPIYIKIIKPVNLNEGLSIWDGTYYIDLYTYGLSSGGVEGIKLYNSNVTIYTSADTNVSVGNPYCDYMFELSGSTLEIQNGTYRTEGKGIFYVSDASSELIINGGYFTAKECVASVHGGSLKLNGGAFAGNYERAQLVYEGSSYNSNISIKNIGALETTFLATNENLTVHVDNMGPRGKVVAYDDGQKVSTLSGGKVYTIRLCMTIKFSESGTSVTVEKGTPYIFPDYDGVPPAGKRFAGWEDVLSGMVFSTDTEHPIDSDLELQPIWEDAETVTITFGANGGSGNMEAQEATASEKYILPECTFEAPEGMVFDKWQIGEAYYRVGAEIVPDVNTTVLAVWKNGISVSYKANGGTGEDVVFYVASGKKIILEENMFTPPEGFSFSKWLVNGAAAYPGKDFTITGDTEIIAQWVEGYYVSYSANGGTGSDIKRNYVGEQIITLAQNSFKAPDGKMFKCWEINGEEYYPGTDITVNSEITISAKWVESYTITYIYTYADPSGEEYTREKTESVAEGTAYTIKHPEELFAVSEKFTPRYWSEKTTAQHQFGDVITVNNDYTFTLVYDTSYSVNFNPANDIDSYVSYSALEGDIIVIPPAPTAPEGKGFVCWEDTEGGKYTPGNTVKIEKSMRFTAIWIEYTELSKLDDQFENGIEERKIYKLPQTTFADGSYESVKWEIISGGSDTGANIYNNTELEVQTHGTITIRMSVTGTDYWNDYEVNIYCVYDDAGICENCGMGEEPQLADGYYQIKSAGNLFWFAQQVNEFGNREIKGALANDIDLGERPWTPIGSTGEGNNNFRGVFDGQGYTIRGLNVTSAKNGIGFFGEVRTGTIKNFTIYGEVTVPGKYTYVGGVIGSACGVNVENSLERNGAIIQNITSYVNVTTNAHGIGRIGGFAGYANHETLIENCAWYGTLDLGEYRAEAGVAGFIGRVQESSDVTIRNCAAYGTVKTNYKKGTYNGSEDIFVCGFLGWSVLGSADRPTNTVIENCLFAGSVELGDDITDKIDYSAFGCLSEIKSIKNCYYLGENGLKGVNNNSSYKPTAAELITVDNSQLASGEVAHKLGSAWGQTIGKDTAPVLNGAVVYKYLDSYSNELIFCIAGYTAEGAVLNIPQAGTYSLVFADYDDGKLNNLEIIPLEITDETTGKITRASQKGITPGAGDEIMLWQGMEYLRPLCDAYLVE